ncbi:MAG: DUF4097 family beta strand repeat-containing protein [Cellulosilyticaceae bacterium]
MLRKRTLAGIAISLIGGGIGISIIGIMLGAHMGVNITSRGIELGPKAMQVFAEGGVSGSSQYRLKEETLAAFSDMNLNIGLAEVEIVSGENYSIAVNHDQNAEVSYEVRDNTLYVTQKNVKFKMGIGVGSIDQGNIRITVPTDKPITVCEVQAGIGTLRVEDIYVSRMNIMGGLGDIYTRELKAQDLTVIGGMGDIEVRGTFEGDINVTGGLGDITLTTAVDEEFYNYNITRGLGTFYFNNRKVDYFDENNGEGKGPYTMKIECGMGNLKINTH